MTVSQARRLRAGLTRFPPPTVDGRGLWLLSLAGAAVMFVVQPPADLWMLAWLAPLPWLAIVQTRWLAVRHPWRTLWVAGLCHWLATIHWLRLPHPATSIGWVALSAYLACYVPLFVAVARRLVHGWRWPLVLAAPVAWLACEQLRGWVLGGFTFGALGHTQWRWTTLIQCADIAGAGAVGGVVMTVAAGVAEVLGGRGRPENLRGRLVGATMAGLVLAAALGYGSARMRGAPVRDDRPFDVLLVQGSIDTELKHDPEAAGAVVRHYDELTAQALAAGAAPPDLIVWPETMWRFGLLEIDPAEVLPERVVEETLGPPSDAAGGMDAAAERQAACRRELARQRMDALATFARGYGTQWLVGVDKQVVTPAAPSGSRHYNCALFLAADGRAVGCYSKCHPVMFGEYVPLADRFPWLYRLTPLPAGLTAGDGPVAVTIGDTRVAVNICYETALPDAVRGMVRRLTRDGGRPDVIVNLTNDGWFWGSSELDMHLTAAIFRAVEVRTPVVIAANTGFSAWIDGTGRLRERGPRRDVATLRARVLPDGRPSPWLAWGSLTPWACVSIAAVALVTGSIGRRPGGSQGSPGRAPRKTGPVTG